YDNGSSFPSTQSHVQDGSVFRDVDLLTAKHRVDSCWQTGLFGELEQEFERLVCHAVLRVVQVETHSLERHPLAALRIFCKELSQMDSRNLFIVRLERFPCLLLHRCVDFIESPQLITTCLHSVAGCLLRSDNESRSTGGSPAAPYCVHNPTRLGLPYST